MKGTRFFVAAIFAVVSVSASAQWSCVDATGNTYKALNRIWADTCTNDATGEVRAPSVGISTQWSCVDATGNTHSALNRIWADTCTNNATGEVRAPNQVPVIKIAPYKSDPVQAKRTIKEGKVAVVNTMKDPDSVKFRNLFTFQDVVLCGEVNAKNSMGGYVGFKRFLSMGAVDLVTIDDGTEGFSDTWLKTCKGMTQSLIDEFRFGR